MGASLSSRFEWAQGVKTEQLVTSAQNQALLYDIISFINQVCQKNTIECKAEFKRSVQWTTSMIPQQFLNNSMSSMFTVQLASSK
jgi:hypothetical protein